MSEVIPAGFTPIPGGGSSPINMADASGQASPPPDAFDPSEMAKALSSASSRPSVPTKWNLYDSRSPQQTLLDYTDNQIPVGYTPISSSSEDTIPSGYTPLQSISSTASLPPGYSHVPDPKSPSDTPPEDGSTIMQNVTGAVTGIAEQATMLSKVIYPLTHAGTVVGGWKGIYDLVTGQGLDKAVADIQKFDDWNAQGLIKKAGVDDKYLTDNAGYKAVMTPMNWLTDTAAEAGAWVSDKTGSPLAGTAVDLFGQLLPFAGAHMAKEAMFPGDAKVKAAAGEARTKALIDMLKTSVDDISPDRQIYQTPVGDDGKPLYSPHEDLARMIHEGAPLSDVLDHLSQHPELHSDNPAGQAVAQAYTQRIIDLGLDKTKVFVDPSIDKPAQYDSVGDYIRVKNAGVSPQDIMHEATHAVIGAAGDFYTEVAAGVRVEADGTRTTLENMTAAQKDIYHRVAGIERLRQIALDYHQAEVDKAGGFTGKYYGLKNVNEFMAETMSAKDFRDLLSKTPVDASELPSLPRGEWNFKSMLDVAKRAIKRMVMPNNSPLLDAAFDHTQGLVDHLTPEMRGKDFTDHVYTSPNADSPLNGRTMAAQSNLAQVLARNNIASARAKVVTRDGQFLMYKLSDLMKEAATPKEFIDRARALWSDANFQKFIDDNGQRMLGNPLGFIKAFHIDNSFDKLSADEKLLTANHLSVDDFMRKHKELAAAQYTAQGFKADINDPKMQLMTKDDLFDDGTFFLPQTQLKMVKATAKGQLSGLVLKYFAEKGDEYRALGAQMYYRGLQHMSDYTELPNASKKRMIQAALQYDNIAGRNTLKAMKLQWPTADMLKEKGLTDPEIKAYQGVAKAMDFAHDLINQALVKDGKPEIEKIPGYFPHFFEGAYRVLIDRIIDSKDPAITPTRYTFRLKGFATRQGAETFAKQLTDGKWDKPGEKWRPRLDPDSGTPYFMQERNYKTMSLADNLYETMQSNHNMDALDPVTQEKLEKMESESMRGSIKHILERSDIEGYRGDLVNDMGFNRGILARLGMDGYNNRLLKTHEVYLKNVSEFYKNTMFMNEVATRLFDHAPANSSIPYFGTYLERMKMLKEYIKEQTANFTGENFNHLNMMIEREIKPMLKWTGLDPELASKTLKSARNFLSLSKLRGNFGFYIGNMVQPMHMVSILSWANEMRRQGGEKVNYAHPITAFYDAIQNRNDPMLKDSLKWASDNHIIDDAMLEYQMRAKAPSTIMNWVHTLTLGKINPMIEMAARSYSFAIAHEYYRKIYGEDSMKVRRAAQQAMEMVNVNYDRSTRPLMYQNFGMAGEAMSPFAVYRNAYIGNNWLMFKAIKSGKFAPQSFLPLLHFQLIYLATAGAAGIMMTDEWDQLVKVWNYFSPGHPLMDSQQASLYLQHKVGASDAFTFGALSNATKIIPGLEHGVNLGSSMTASGLDSSLTTALNPFLAAIANLGAIGVKATAHAVAPDSFAGVNIANAWPDLEQLVPQPFKGVLEGLGQPNPSVAMKTTNYEGYVERQKPDVNSMMLFGRLSVEEAKARALEKSVNQYSEFEKEHLKELVSNAATYASMGKYTQQDYSDALRQAVNDLDIDPDEFAKMVAEEVTKRVTTAKERENNLDSTAAAHARRTRELFGGFGQ